MEILLADFLNRLAFLPIANIINVLHRNVDYQEALRGANSQKAHHPEVARFMWAWKDFPFPFLGLVY